MELDTYEEASEFRALVIFISEIQKRRQSTKVIDAFHELLKVKKFYPKILEPKYTKVYRGSKADRRSPHFKIINNLIVDLGKEELFRLKLEHVPAKIPGIAYI